MNASSPGQISTATLDQQSQQTRASKGSGISDARSYSQMSVKELEAAMTAAKLSLLASNVKCNTLKQASESFNTQHSDKVGEIVRFVDEDIKVNAIFQLDVRGVIAGQLQSVNDLVRGLPTDQSDVWKSLISDAEEERGEAKASLDELVLALARKEEELAKGSLSEAEEKNRQTEIKNQELQQQLDDLASKVEKMESEFAGWVEVPFDGADQIA